MNISDLPVDTWLVVKHRSSHISTLISMHTTLAEAEAARDKLNEGSTAPCYSACILVEPVAQGMNHARRRRRS